MQPFHGGGLPGTRPSGKTFPPSIRIYPPATQVGEQKEIGPWIP